MSDKAQIKDEKEKENILKRLDSVEKRVTVLETQYSLYKRK